MARSGNIIWNDKATDEQSVGPYQYNVCAAAEDVEAVDTVPRIMPSIVLGIGLWGMIIFAIWHVVA
jgi:hypothetical protein